MRLTRPLAVVFAGALLICSVNSTEAVAAPSKTKQIAAAFKKARTLYRQGKYQEAIRAFDEISGENITEEVLDSIFARFCIGK